MVEQSKARTFAERVILRAIISTPGPWPFLAALVAEDFEDTRDGSFVRDVIEADGATESVYARGMLDDIDESDEQGVEPAAIADAVRFILRRRARVRYQVVRHLGVPDDETLRDLVRRRRRIVESNR